MTLANSPSPNKRQTRTDVLVVDDSFTDLRLLLEMMTLQDLRISIAIDGTRGYQQAVTLQPGLVLLDVRMPDMTGFAVCQRLKANELTKRIPVIFLTAANDLADRLEGFTAGGVDYIGKPFEAQEVLARIGVHLHSTDGPIAEPIEHVITDRVAEGDIKDTALVEAARRLLRNAIANPPGLEHLARMLCTNRRRLNDSFQAVCGQPVFGWLREERLRQGYFLVSQTTTPFSIISEALGYSTHANFTKSFRLRYGFPPGEVRATVQGSYQADAEFSVL
ncbi:MAG: response regulator [Proteobacteria bacterium]|nr:response regulator [Pseudomonadota bacterium]